MTNKELLALIKHELISNIENEETDHYWAETDKEFDINFWKEIFQIIENNLDLLETILKNSTIYTDKQNNELKLKCELTIDDENYYKYALIIDDEIKRREE